MRATDIIRGVLDLIDKVESPAATAEIEIDAGPEAEHGEPVASRFKQIYAMLSNPSRGPLANSPNEVVADIDSVTTLAGGGWNGPKHVDDIRIKDPRGYE